MRDVDRGRRSSAAGVFIGALLVIAIMAFIAFVSLAQVSSSGTGERIMARTVATMTEIDSSITNIQTSLQESADQSEQDPVPVPNFPIVVELSRADALAIDRQQLRDEILAQSADQMYDHGTAVWDDADPEAVQGIGTQSTAGGIRAGLWFVRGTPHLIYIALAVVSGLAAVALAVALTLQMEALRRLLAFGILLLAAGIPAIVIVLLVRLITGSFGDDPFGDSMSDIVLDAEGVALRNYVIVTGLGAALFVLGLAGSLLESRENTHGPSFDTYR